MMKPIASIIFAITCAFALGCSNEIGVSDVQFGTFTGVGSTTIKFKAGNTLSKSDEAVYGWFFSMKNPPKEITIKEVIEAPIGGSWSVPPSARGIDITNDGKTVSVTKTISNPGSPFLFHHWSVSSTDPIGNYKAALYVEGQLVKEVDFAVVE